MSLPLTVSYEPDGSPALRERKLAVQVSRLQTGLELCREVYELIKGELKNPLEEYSLFWPEQKIWLPVEKQFGLMPANCTRAKLEFKSKKRCLRIRFLDASSKLIKVDETQPVKELVRDLCAQLRFEHPEEMSLVVAGDYAATKHHPTKTAKTMAKRMESASPSLTRRMTGSRGSKVPGATKDISSKDSPPPLSPSMRRRIHMPGSAGSAGSVKKWKVKKQISKKHQIRLDTPWLDPHKTLAEQEVTEQDELVLMYRFYYHMELDKGSPNVEMLYKQARTFYLAGELLCSQNDMVRLSAILCQITKGEYANHKYSPEFLVQLKTVIAPPKCKIKAIAKQITAEHASLKGLSGADAKCWFVKLWSSLELFGFEFLSCTNLDTKDNGLIGISKDRILFLFHKKKKNLCWDIDTLMQWKNDPLKDTVSLTFSHEGTTQVLNLHLPDYSGVLVDCIQGHRDLSDQVPSLSRAFHAYQFDEDLESAIGDFAAQTRKDTTDRRTLRNLTYEDVYWTSRIENPLFSDEELTSLHGNSWENPAFQNMDQLMDERFSFLDFTEYDTSTSTSTTMLTDTSSSRSSDRSPSHTPLSPTRSLGFIPPPNPTHSPSDRKRSLDASPLVTASRSAESSPRPSLPPRPKLTNGLLDAYFKGHSRNTSGSSSSGEEAHGSKEELKKKVDTLQDQDQTRVNETT